MHDIISYYIFLLLEKILLTIWQYFNRKPSFDSKLFIFDFYTRSKKNLMRHKLTSLIFSYFTYFSLFFLD